MAVDRVRQRYGLRGSVACLRALRGEDEDAVAAGGGGTPAALQLLDRLLVADPAGVRVPAADLVTADRDRLLAAVYERTYGARVATSARCARCEAPFDVDFSLHDLQRAADGAAAAEGGLVTLPDGRRYRLPTGRDECAVHHLEPAAAASALLAACALDGVHDGDAESVPALMERAAPVLDAELAAQCPECGLAQTIGFDVQSYLLASLAADAPQLVHDVHLLASAYGWSRSEILALTREQRRAHVALIDTASRPHHRARSQPR